MLRYQKTRDSRDKEGAERGINYKYNFSKRSDDYATNIASDSNDYAVDLIVYVNKTQD